MTTPAPPAEEERSVALLQRVVAAVESACAGLEARCGLALSALLFGLLLMGLAALLQSTPSTRPVNHGVLYARLSEAPFAFGEGNWVHARLLTPLLGHVLHLRGRAFILLPLVMGVLLLASVYWHYRRQRFGAAASLGLASTIAFSTPILFPLYGAGYVDTTSSLLLFWCFALPHRPAWRALLLTLALFNHEHALFALPWVLLPPEGERLVSRRTVLTLALCVAGVALLFLWRDTITDAAHIRLSNEFYLRRIDKNWRIIRELAPLGIFEAFRLFWFFPVLAVVESALGGEWRRLLWLAAVLLGAGGQLVFGHDVSRMMGLAFPAVLKGAEILRSRRGEEAFNRILWALVLLNFLLRPYEVRPPLVRRFWPAWWAPVLPPLPEVSWPPPAPAP